MYSFEKEHCIICLEKGNLIEYNHCGKYYVHENCINNWKINDCFICRECIIPVESVQSVSIVSEVSEVSEIPVESCCCIILKKIIKCIK